MSNVGIKPSKKYSLGSVHENGTGRFEILDRFLENNVIMLKFKWLSGEFVYKIDTNKESNVNASIWKFKNVRGLLPSQQHEETEVMEGISNLNDKMDEIMSEIERREQLRLERVEKLYEELSRQQNIIIELTNMVRESQITINNLTNQFNLADKLIDKM